MSHVHTLGGSGCMPRSSPLPINSRKGCSRGQSGWRVNLDPPPWMFRWCHKPDLWPRSLAATRPMLNLNFRGPDAIVHTKHMQTLIYLWTVHAHKCTYKMQHQKQFERKGCINVSPKMLSTLVWTFFHWEWLSHDSNWHTECEASLSFILKLDGVQKEALSFLHKTTE